MINGDDAGTSLLGNTFSLLLFVNRLIFCSLLLLDFPFPVSLDSLTTTILWEKKRNYFFLLAGFLALDLLAGFLAVALALLAGFLALDLLAGFLALALLAGFLALALALLAGFLALALALLLVFLAAGFLVAGFFLVFCGIVSGKKGNSDGKLGQVPSI